HHSSCFFFSSRRRHTRFSRDWSSDVCSSDLLAAQFESLVHPFTIMMSLPFAVIGAFIALLVTGEYFSMLAMIGLIMLMGLVTKKIGRASCRERVELLVDVLTVRRRTIVETSI